MRPLARREVVSGSRRRRGGPAGAGRVVITDAEQRSVLAAARGLAAAGFDVTVLGTRPRQLSLWSRACHHRGLVADPRVNGERFRADLEHLLREEAYDVVVPGTEQSLMVLAEAAPGASLLADCGIPVATVVGRSLDKLVLGAAAESVGMPPPPTVFCETHDAAVDAARWFGHEIVVKPMRSVQSAGAGLHWRKSAPASGVEGCRRTIESFTPPLLIQLRAAHRAVLSLSGVLHGGKLRAICLSRYQRSWPPPGGVAAFAVTVRPPAMLVDAVTTMMLKIGWSGIFEVEMLEMNAGAPAVVDLNPRLFGTLALPIAAGANLPAVWCSLVIGNRPAFVQAAPGVSYRFEEGDLRFLLQEARSWHWKAVLAAAAPRRHTTHALFDRRDPLPLLAWGASAGRAARPPRVSSQQAGAAFQPDTGLSGSPLEQGSTAR
jgi:hypothetical protein